LRDFILCAVIVTIVSSGTTVAQRYITNHLGDRKSQPADPLARSSSTEQGVQQDLPGESGPDGTTSLSQILDPELAHKPERPVIEKSPRDTVRKPEAQPWAAISSPIVLPAKPEKKMVGPDGVAFTRSATAPKAAAVVRESRPISPELLRLPDQAKATDPQSVVTPERAENPADAASASHRERQQPTIAASNQSEAGIADGPVRRKAGGEMVGPDGVIYRHAEGPRGVAPR
jgi:hypothetical protein